MRVGKTLEYIGARSFLLFDSPWYQITPLMPKPMNGATIPLYRYDGAHEAGFGCHECFGKGAPASFAASSSRFSRARTAGMSAVSFAILLHSWNTGIREESALMPSRLIHASTGVPPQVSSIRPIATFSRC